MKKVRLLTAFCLLALATAIVTAIISFFGGRFSARAEEIYEPYENETYIRRYDLTFDVNADRSMHVTEDIYVKYMYNRAMARYIPCNGGEIIKNISAHELNGDGSMNKISYDVMYGETGYLALEIDEGRYIYGEKTYRIEYDYFLTKAQEGKNNLTLNAVGAGWECDIYDINVKLLLPEGLKSADCYVGEKDDGNDKFTPEISVEDGRNVVAFHVDKAGKGVAVTVNAEFGKGLGVYSDMTPYYFVIAGAAVILLIIAFKFTLFFNRSLVAVVSFEAPDGMDPLMMGKLIDNKVNSEDITSLIFYWADKGFLKINMENPSDPVLLREAEALPATYPDYQHIMFSRIFGNAYEARPKTMGSSFAGCVETVKKKVDDKAHGMHNPYSVGISVLFAVVCALIMGLTPAVLSIVNGISNGIFGGGAYWQSVIICIPALFIYAFAESVWYNRLKWKKWQTALFLGAIFTACAICTVAYTFLVSDALLPKLAKALLCAAGFGGVILAVTLISRTKEYSAKLDKILGFRKFILYTEKDKLEKMLEETPSLYYHVLPYAQVLGVSDKWEDKFKELTVAPPEWAVTPVGAVLQFNAMNIMIRSSISTMSSRMIMKSPGSAGFSGSHGHFGGFSGGGHGGGGGGFR